MYYDYLVVGSGLFGAAFAQRMLTLISATALWNTAPSALKRRCWKCPIYRATPW